MLPKPTSCETCIGWGWGRQGYVPASGSGSNGVLVVLEAAGEDEAKSGLPTVGRAGHYLWSNLARVGLEREDFRIHNVLSCQPPKNQLAKMPYEADVIASCAPNLDATIADMQERCRVNGKHLTILTLGQIAFKRVMGLTPKDPILRVDHNCYPLWSEKYQAYVVSADHPSYLMRGNNHLLPILQFATKRAVEVANNGVVYHSPDYLRDPNPATFEQWIRDYLVQADRDRDTYLAFDIETPHKQGKDEEKVAREDDDDYTILRCSFAYKANEAVSVPWRAEYLPLIEELFSAPYAKLVWNENYDVPRITTKMSINGSVLDGMLAWHVLNSALPKGLGFVTPFYCKDMRLWKHQSNDDPAGYNCQDSDALLRDFLGIKADLVKNNQWPVFDRHVVQLNKVLTYMSTKGVLRDETMRQEAEVKLSGLLDEIEVQMDQAVPQAARRLSPKNGYKKAPKNTDGLITIRVECSVRRCSECGIANPTKSHFKAIKRPTEAKPQNPCYEGGTTISIEAVERFAKVLEFKVSKVGLTKYQQIAKHQAIVDRRDNKTTFDEDAIKKLVKKYPKDPLYPLILNHREYGKLLGTYVGVTQENGRIRGGLQIGRDGRIHPVYSHNPSTLRLACQNPNMQNLPRSKGNDDLQTIIRNLVIADEGNVFIELDFSAIEAVLVGYFAGSADYIRLAKLGIHSYLASHVLGRPADLKWSDQDLKQYFKEIKKSKDQSVQDVYNSSKRVTHLSGYGGTPHKMHLAEPEAFPTIKDAERLQGIYFDLCPYIKKWHLATQLQAEKDGFLRNPFGYVHRFNRVFSYKKIGGQWKREQGDDANKCLAFLPQSTAAGIIKEAMLRLYFDRFEEAGQFLRLQIHDSLLSEMPKDRSDEVAEWMKLEMEAPIPELRLPASYGMGPFLSIDTEKKVGVRWGSMS